jgi:hypothetical protein
MRNQWQLEHGILFFVIGSVSRGHKSRFLEVDAPEHWGHFSLIRHPASRHGFFNEVPKEFPDVAVPFITFAKIKESQILRERLTQGLSALSSDENLFGHLNRCRRQLNDALRRWERRPWSQKREQTSHTKPNAFAGYVKAMLKLVDD